MGNSRARPGAGDLEGRHAREGRPERIERGACEHAPGEVQLSGPTRPTRRQRQAGRAGQGKVYVFLKSGGEGAKAPQLLERGEGGGPGRGGAADGVAAEVEHGEGCEARHRRA